VNFYLTCYDVRETSRVLQIVFSLIFVDDFFLKFQIYILFIIPTTYVFRSTVLMVISNVNWFLTNFFQFITKIRRINLV